MHHSILERISQGDPSGIAACLDEYGGTIWGLAERYLRGTGEDVEDAVQEIFIEVWRSAHRFSPALGSEPAFVATIAHRRLIDRQRRLAARGTHLPFDPSLTHAPPQRLDTASLRDDLHRAARAFDELDTDERQVLWYALYHGLSHERIAHATDLPLGTVKTRIRRGLSRLRDILAGRTEKLGGVR
ncbi:MAG: sigma-70 family RNA polymerase sigma factor [Phycisphaeraceae bacterium]|nr:sigma-70 family RNA polymerase sigma factor [Phycisphaeraceae bacterium]